MFVLMLAARGGMAAQLSMEDFPTGAAARAWQHWDAAMQAFLERTEEAPDKIEQAFGQLLELDPSPLRVALLAARTIDRTPFGGAVLLFEQDLELDAVGPNGQAVGELLLAGREQVAQAGDGWYFCQIGRFDVADANFRALLEFDPDPVALLELTEQVGRRREILFQVIDNPIVGESARQILRLLDRGELAIKADPRRIRENIERLGGTPRGFENAVAALRDSGEYAVPFLIEHLQDDAKRELLRPILRCLPRIDRPALNPLVMALRVEDPVVRQYVVDGLGQIGYAQAVPYLLQVAEKEETRTDLQSAIRAALERIAARSPAAPVNARARDAFFMLAEQYYDNVDSLAADPRLDTADVWYWRDGLLLNIEVPTPVFNEIMAMRSCEEALRLDPGHQPSLALWLAANFRREAQLPTDASDDTRPEDFPTAAYFARVAGAEHCLMALARAVEDGDPAVALGMIRALRETAGPASLVSDEAGRLPLAQALTFPDRMVRIQAALTLGHGRPEKPFKDYQNLMPVLSEALMLHGGARNALVVDPDDSSSNLVAAALRAQGFEVLIDTALYPGLQKVRDELPGVDVIFIASDIAAPTLVEGLAALRSEFRFAATPVVIITKPGDSPLVDTLVKADHRLAQVPVNAQAGRIERALANVMRAVGTEVITAEIGAELAYEAAVVLELLAETNNPLFDVADAEPALLVALSTEDTTLRLKVVEVLGYLGSAKAQEAIARIALEADQPEEIRVKMFAALAEAAKRRGALLGHEFIEQIVALAESEPNMIIREAAARALGALSVSGEPASRIIRNQYQG